MTAPARVAVKICGVCTPDDARTAAEAGAAYIGVILAPGRTRSQTIAQAGVIFNAATGSHSLSGAPRDAATSSRNAAAPRDAASPRRVGVFVDASAEVVADAARALALDAVQLHGDEPVELVRQIRDAVTCEVWKALRVRAAADVSRAADTWAGVVDALLLDGWSPGVHGGAGVQFDWGAVAGEWFSGGRPDGGVRLIVAGGLTPENVAQAVSLLRPSVVDVSSGVEAAPGRKSSGKIHAFIAAARGAGISR